MTTMAEPEAAAPAAAPAMPAPPSPQAMTPPGPTGPATMAPNKQGQRLQGMLMANIGLTALDRALGMLGSQSPEGQAILKAITPLSKIFQAPRNQDLSNAEMKLMGAQQRPMSGGVPGQGGQGSPAMMARDRLAALGMGGMGGGPQGA